MLKVKIIFVNWQNYGPSEIWSDGYWVLYIDKPMRYRHNNLFLS